MTKLGLRAKKEIEAQEKDLKDSLSFIKHELSHNYIDSDDAWQKTNDLSDSDAWFDDIEDVMEANEIQTADDYLDELDNDRMDAERAGDSNKADSISHFMTDIKATGLSFVTPYGNTKRSVASDAKMAVGDAIDELLKKVSD